MSNKMTSIIFLLLVLFISLGVSILIKGGWRFHEGFHEGFQEGLTDDQTTVINLVKQYNKDDLAICLELIYKIQPLVTSTTDTNQKYISDTIQKNFSCPSTILNYIVNKPKDAKTPTDFKIPDNVEEAITTYQPQRNKLCSKLIEDIFTQAPNLTTKQGNQAPKDLMLSQKLNDFKKSILNGTPPLPGTDTDIALFLSEYFYSS
jgi:hypothetical protein